MYHTSRMIHILNINAYHTNFVLSTSNEYEYEYKIKFLNLINMICMHMIQENFYIKSNLILLIIDPGLSEEELPRDK